MACIPESKIERLKQEISLGGNQRGNQGRAPHYIMLGVTDRGACMVLPQ